MISLEEAIEKRDVAQSLETLKDDPQQVKAPTKLGVSMLMLALYFELPEVAKAIRAHMPTLTFFEAAAMGELDAVKKSVEADAKMVDAFAPDGFTVLGLTIFFRQPEVATYLMDAGADVNLAAANARKVAPVHAACARQDLSMLKRLLDKGADPDAAQEGGFTALRAAIQTGNVEMEALLRSAGATRD